MGLGGSGKAARNAEIARNVKLDEEERARQDRIRQGQSTIDQNFSQFNDDYYGKLQQDYLDYYNPQIDKQYEEARKKLIYSLAESGGLESTAGAKALADLQEALNTQRTSLGRSAQGLVDERRGAIEQSKSDLYGLNTSAADPSLASARALASVGSLNTPLATSPIGDLFGSFLSNYAAYQGGKNQNNMKGFGGGGFSPGSASGSSSSYVRG
ncbi:MULTISPECIES: hypothetical protein [Chelatococcus]|uniref:Uncharacterized protein n=1 Tax=Chelatococcus caeni TaxID=1348468 RepID=A0A840C1P4_9HYPH|nr:MULTISPECIES: hypothetical protein [Chelatococcus]ALA16077.1 hypothetical protein AL346_00055 [Chelatococcus sp. CO-6]MBB4017578.1 hypothetical protein [Chelatococcus caeni]